MIVDMFSTFVDYKFLILCMVYLIVIDSTFILASPIDKAKRVLKKINTVNKRKRHINRLLNITMSCKDISIILDEIINIRVELYDIVKGLDENSSTKKLKANITSELYELHTLYDMVSDLYYVKIINKNPLSTYDNVMEILIKYKPIYLKIHNQIDIGDIVL